jgi:flagellar hook-associated protein 3 FlgL
MLTRVGDFAHHRHITGLVSGTQSKLREVQAQIASGRRAERHSDIAGEAARLLEAEDMLRRAETYVRGNGIAIGRLTTMDRSLETLSSTAERLRVLLSMRLTDATGQDLPLDLEAEQLLATATNALNVKLDGRYLFAGTRTQTKPVEFPSWPPSSADADPAVYYQGDTVRLGVRADDNLEITYGVTADRAAFADLVAALGLAIEGHQANDRTQIEAALSKVNAAVEGLAGERGRLGATMVALEDANRGHEGEMLQFKTAIGEIRDVDVAEAMTRLASHQTLLEASFVTLGRLANLSLANYLR